MPPRPLDCRQPSAAEVVAEERELLARVEVLAAVARVAFCPPAAGRDN
jgi:hypothetical protein